MPESSVYFSLTYVGHRLILIKFASLISKNVSFIYIVWLLLPFYRILKLQFIVQNGFLLWVDLARETSGSGTIICLWPYYSFLFIKKYIYKYLWTVLQIVPGYF
jgi:hypothetical protein